MSTASINQKTGYGKFTPLTLATRNESPIKQDIIDILFHGGILVVVVVDVVLYHSVCVIGVIFCVCAYKTVHLNKFKFILIYLSIDINKKIRILYIFIIKKYFLFFKNKYIIFFIVVFHFQHLHTLLYFLKTTTHHSDHDTKFSNFLDSLFYNLSLRNLVVFSLQMQRLFF